MKSIWFKKKSFGWGWAPANWKGWTALGVYVGLVSGLAFYVERDASNFNVAGYLVSVALLTVGFIGFCWAKGEKLS